MSHFLMGKIGFPLIVVVAEATSQQILPSELTPLINVGAIGCVLAWFLLKMEPRMRKQEEAYDRHTRMLGFVVVALKSVHPAVKEQVDTILKEVEEADALRKK